MYEYHKHHIIPKHRINKWFLKNIIDEETKKWLLKQTIKITIEEHIKIHKYWYEEYNNENDFHAYKMLSGNMDNMERLYLNHQKYLRSDRNPSKKRGPWNKGKNLTPDHKEKISISVSGEKNGFYGKTHTDKTKQLLREQTKHRVQGKNNPFYGKTHTDKTKKILSVYAKQRTGKLSSRQGTGTKYKLIDPTGKEYIITEGITHFCKKHGLNAGFIIQIAKRNKGTNKGWKAYKL